MPQTRRAACAGAAQARRCWNGSRTCERRRETIDRFAPLLDPAEIDVAEKVSRLGEVGHAFRTKLITRAAVASTATRSVPMINAPTGFGVPMIGPSPSIPTTASTIASCGRIVAFRSRIDCLDAANVQQVLRPAVDGSGHRAEQILHAARHAGPMMRLQLRHARQRGRRRRSVAGSSSSVSPVNELRKRRRSHVVVIEIDERDAARRGDDRTEPGARRQVLDIAAMTGSLATTTSAAPARWSATAAPATTADGC